ncbi:MAG: hypothetical protein WCL49_01590 [bacterium]
MEHDIQLVAWDGARNNFSEIRPLTEQEIVFDKRATPIFSEARGRFKLFHILEFNYNDWVKYQRELLSAGPRKDDCHLVLDRLLFNFLASAYGVIEHFEVSYRQRYRKNNDKLKEYESFFRQFCENSWAVSFFLDFRNYAQHVALPIGNFNRSEDIHSIRISITHEASSLVRDYNGWKRSKLSADKGQLDLISLTEEYYHRLRRDYGSFMARCFYPELVDIDAFYWALTQEVRQRNPSARMVFMTAKEETKQRTRTNVKWTFVQPPQAVYDELGITVEKKTD